jgi:hypothetical protein
MRDPRLAFYFAIAGVIGLVVLVFEAGFDRSFY